jgi:hypothetical protein
MFFTISTNIDTKFPNNHFIDKLWINLDNGWTRSGPTFFKGYQDNFCKIIVDSEGARIEHSVNRSFPLWCEHGLISNLNPATTQVWSDDTVRIDSLGRITLGKLDIDLTMPTEVLTVQQAVDRIGQILDSKINAVPYGVKLFCSGGVDTLLLYSMLPEFELVTEEHFESDRFTDANKSSLQQFWSYNQIHHWTSATWLATGSHGDEYFLRGPAAIGMLTAWHDINFGQLLSENPDCYHYHHFSKYSDLWSSSWGNRHQLRQAYPSIEDLNRQILNMLVNDYQHWHLGNTLTWTPFKDLAIAKILLQCPVQELIPQFLDAKISKDLIVAYNPQIVSYVSKYKNHNSSENIPKLVEYYRDFG